MKLHSGILLYALSLCALLSSCTGEQPAGLYPAPLGAGPKIVFDLDHKPFPDIPLPSDLATRIDPGSPTGRRINVSTEAPTELEREVRRKINGLEGFGTFQPIAVSFDKPLDLQNIVDRHKRDLNFMDDAVYLINLNPQSARFGQAVPLDFGQGNFPLVLTRPANYFKNDPRSMVENLTFDTVDEDKNGDGVLQLEEDTDGDGFLDKPHVFPAGGDPVDDLLTFFDRESNTLLFRPVMPLEQESTYAVVLTRRLVGEEGNPVRSPFKYINHAKQNGDLKHLLQALRNYGLGYQDLSFVWTYTTLGPTRDLEALRRGLYGHGPFARLKNEFPARIEKLHLMKDTGEDRHMVVFSLFKQHAKDIAELILGGMPQAQIDALMASFDNVDYLISGEVTGPNLMVDRDGIAEAGYPADNDESWELDRLTGEAVYGRGKITFWCTIPKPDRGAGPPFPVSIYSHGYTGTRMELLAFAGNLARHGLASCALDTFGHGMVIKRADKVLIRGALQAFNLGGFLDAIVPGRARDLNNDGEPNSGGDFWTADAFHTRDVVRQTTLDHMMFIRVLRAFDGKRKWPVDLIGPDIAKPAGDFNGDGIVDIGGPDQDYHVWGISMGGIHSSVLPGIEPAITAAAPVAGGSGLVDITARSTQGGVVEAVFLKLMGPIIAGLAGDGPDESKLTFIIPDVNGRAERHFHTTSAVAPGDLVRVVNRNNGEMDQVVADGEGRFRLHIPADALDAVEKRARLKLDPLAQGFTPETIEDTTLYGDLLEITIFQGTDTSQPKEVINTFGEDMTFQGAVYPKGQPLVAPTKGFGLKRNTRDLRRFMLISQMIVDPADPISYAPHYHLNPLQTSDYDTATPGANVLVIPTNGDSNVPVNTGIATARAAGIIDLYKTDPRYGKTQNQVLIDNYVLEGVSRLNRFNGDARFTGRSNVALGSVLMDVDNLSNTNMDGPNKSGDGFRAPRLDPPLRLSVHTANGLAAMRIPYLRRTGKHGFDMPQPDWPFDVPTFMIHQIGRFFITRGRELRDDACMQDASCSWLPAPSAP